MFISKISLKGKYS